MEFILTVFLRDAYKRRTRKRYQLEVVDHAQALVRAASLVDAISAAVGSEVLKYTVAQEVAYTDTVEVGANVDEGVTFSADLGAGKTAAIKLPSPIAGYINGDGTINMTHSAITDFESEFLSGEVLVSDGEVVLDLVSGKLDK